MPTGPRRHRRHRLRELAAAEEALQIAFQPIVDLRSGVPLGYEALSRFPSRSPDWWFAEAHHLGRGIELELTAVARALEARDPSWDYISVNVSPLAVCSTAFIEFILDLPEPRRLVLELTEHSAVHDYEALTRAVARLREAGLRVAVDDAGGGVSSFRHILMIGPEVIKLDRSLIAGLNEHPGRQALAELLAQFAERLGADLIAEGIEREEEREACVQFGIVKGQGYLLGAPAPRGGDGGWLGGLDPPCKASRLQ